MVVMTASAATGMAGRMRTDSFRTAGTAAGRNRGGKSRKFPLQILGITFRAALIRQRLRIADQCLKLMLTVFANIFVNRHDCSLCFQCEL